MKTPWISGGLRKHSRVLCINILLGAAFACGSERANQPPPTHADVRRNDTERDGQQVAKREAPDEGLQVKAPSGGGDLVGVKKDDVSQSRCPDELQEADADVKGIGGKLAVDLTTKKDVESLRSKVRAVAEDFVTRASRPEGIAQVEASVAHVSLQDINDGVRLLFTPKPGKSNALRTALESEVERVNAGQCAVGALGSAETSTTPITRH